jgi:hypothetical protein
MPRDILAEIIAKGISIIRIKAIKQIKTKNKSGSARLAAYGLELS